MECPYCDHPVIEGADHCDECGLPLDDTSLPEPANAVELALLTDRVSLFEGRRPLLISPSLPVREAIRLLALNNIGCMLVVEKGELVGIFTERDVLLKVGEDLATSGEKPVSQFMTANVQSLPVTAKVAFALHRMDLGGYRHVPIVNEHGRPVGIFSLREMLRYLTRTLAE
ncbi:inosine 5'-monophosphate dehydrogenase [Anatilimnocola aggregata]|uniref:Inosine 5'-monophosphate dehydrogenase n=1 Tax=Anatilimnocola aggregata TaxID=2528021 RepID=A0A517YKZ3_9BACT|nr:CBS domain-containing protein [Anatilimnocola aggregata]QDU30891.1 inosine 5'-monophosphate dehydrogenase [Anatilimnocola aggregata]